LEKKIFTIIIIILFLLLSILNILSVNAKLIKTLKINENIKTTLTKDDDVTRMEKLPNKWAILCIFDSSGLRYDCYKRVYEILVDDLGFPEDHVFSLVEQSFTVENIRSKFAIIRRESGQDATIVFWMCSHGYAKSWPIHSYTKTYDGYISDNKLNEILDTYTISTQKVLVCISSCEAGGYAANDVTGWLHVFTHYFFSDCGGRNRIVITDSTIRARAFVDYQVKYFWEEGVSQGKSVEEAWFYYKINCFGYSVSNRPCMNDQYPGDMFL